MNKSKATMMLMVALGALAVLPSARADEWNQKTIFTFGVPVEVPGQVLPAGTYVFKLLNSSSDRHIVQVFSKNEAHLYDTFLAIPDYRLKPSDKPIITFEERAAGSPQAVKAWFYPGKNYGNAFVYPKPEAVALAKANNVPVPAMPAEVEAKTTKPVTTTRQSYIVALRAAPLKAEKPTEEEVEIAEVFAPATPSAPDTLPKTASPLPLIGLLGLLSLGAAATLRLAAARAK
jgi:hypothetical protein